MTPAKISILSGFETFIPPDVFGVEYSDESLLIRVENDNSGLTAKFSDAIGFRLLDEGDLLEFWSGSDYKPEGWAYEVYSGGWLELESSRTGFLSANRQGLREFLIATNNDCVSVLAFSRPTTVLGAT